MRRYGPLCAILLVGLSLMGCASPAEVNNMLVDQSVLVRASADSKLIEGINIKSVKGGEETNPMWTSEVSNSAFNGALTGSLKQSGLLGSSAETMRYDLVATFYELKQPVFGLNFKVTSSVNYQITDPQSKNTWFNKDIVASYTATFSDAAMAIQRLRLANEGSIRENIKQFIEQLVATKPPG